jgi:hypothetical protein
MPTRPLENDARARKFENAVRASCQRYRLYVSNVPTRGGGRNRLLSGKRCASLDLRGKTRDLAK